MSKKTPLRRLTELSQGAIKKAEIFMTQNYIKKYDNVNISVESLMPHDKAGWVKKEGGTMKTWKRRYMVLKEDVLYWFESETVRNFECFTGFLKFALLF